MFENNFILLHLGETLTVHIIWIKNKINSCKCSLRTTSGLGLENGGNAERPSPGHDK